MVEVKADVLEQSFDAIESQDVSQALAEELRLLKARMNAGLLAGAGPVLESGIKSFEATGYVERYLRRGVESGLELKAADNSSGASGGYSVPREIDEQIDRTLVARSPIRSIANVVRVGSSNYRKLVTNGGTPSGWTGFEAARPETATPTFSEIVPPSGELYANPAASQQMLDDAMFDVEAFLATEIATEFARAEGKAFVSGTGVSQPLGFLASPTATTADNARPMGTLQTLGTGAAGAFPAANPQDKLLDLVQSLRQPYRQGAVFVMNSATAAIIRKFKTSDGAFLWQPGLMAGQPATLLGYPLIEAEDMPDVAANSLSIAFGNFKQGYVITERGETNILRDPYTHKPYVHFYATQILDAHVQGVVETNPSDDPPANPPIGGTYIVGGSPTGDWEGYAKHIASWTIGGWRFQMPQSGFRFTVRSTGHEAAYRDPAWVIGEVMATSLRIQDRQVVGSQRNAISAPASGPVQDVEVRVTVSEILSALRAHGLIAT